jgi:RecA-family ATPase
MLPTMRAAHLTEPVSSQAAWLIEGLWSNEAVGIIGGEPKCGKSFLALDLAVAVASGTPCLRHFPTRQFVAAGRVSRSADGYRLNS